ncbi:hypothetical protein [Sphaerochaeta sp. S2]|uniref:hypothetical protein n=1 Tax=Sphaerochaeta sp. S2 TaxID=2798868 RepID=UPI0018E9D88A|nr:hypothetical protein [Sphaerochaeta sp. S2]MBJ2356686.1 hypothetical protein [Sphaerochaeta sp. S2]
MTDDDKLAMCYQVIGDTATEISQAYSDFGDLVGYYMGQTSTTLQLRLFRPLALETSLYLLSLLDTTSEFYTDIHQETEKLAEELEVPSLEERLATYKQGTDSVSHFVTACQQVVGSDALWLSMRRKDTPPQETISDRGYVVIKSAAEKIEEVVESLK